jgi:hypothetical protein
MLADAREFVLRAWWVVTLPGVMIFVTVLAFNLLGDGLRDTFDPKLKRCRHARLQPHGDAAPVVGAGSTA